MPLTAAPIACSRTPKKMLRPDFSAVKRSDFGKIVFVDSVRSAAPPIIVGVNGSNAAMTWPPTLRVASFGLSKRLGQRVGHAGQRAARAGPGEVPLGGAIGVGLAPGGERLVPRRVRLGALVLHREGLVGLVGDVEGLVGIPAERLLGERDLLVAERRAVRRALTLLVGRRVADDRLDADQRRLVLVGHALAHRRLDRVEVVGVGDLQHLPAVGLEAHRDVLAVEAQRRRTVERDVVVVVEVDDAPEGVLAGERRGLRRDALHEVTVGDDRERVVIDDLGAEVLAQVLLGDRHADAVAEALAERAGGDLDAGRDDVAILLRMARGDRSPLAELLDLVDRDVVAREMQHGVQQHRAVARAQDEAIAVGPRGLRRVVLHDAPEQHICCGRHGHRQAGVPGVGLLDRVH